jgi:hypothetical protein
MPTAAGQIWPHLAHDDGREVKQERTSLADSLWPSLSRAAKAKERDQRLWDEIVKRNRDNFLREWRRERGR